VHNDIQEVCGNARLETALVLMFVENAKQPSPTEKSSRRNLYYIMQKDGACDFVLPPVINQQFVFIHQT